LTINEKMASYTISELALMYGDLETFERDGCIGECRLRLLFDWYNTEHSTTAAWPQTITILCREIASRLMGGLT